METFTRNCEIDEIQLAFQHVTDAPSEAEALVMADEAFRRLLYAVDHAHYCEAPSRAGVIRAVLAIQEAAPGIVSVSGLEPESTLRHVNAAAMLIACTGGYLPPPAAGVYRDIEERARLLSAELTAAVLRRRVIAQGDSYPRYLAQLAAREASRVAGQLLN